MSSRCTFANNKFDLVKKVSNAMAVSVGNTVPEKRAYRSPLTEAPLKPVQNLVLQSPYHNDRGVYNFIKKIMALYSFSRKQKYSQCSRDFSRKLRSRFYSSLSRDLKDVKIPGRLPEVNYSSGHAHENLRIIYLPSSSRRGRHFARLAVVSKT